MKINEDKLKQIIREEVEKVLNEEHTDGVYTVFVAPMDVGKPKDCQEARDYYNTVLFDHIDGLYGGYHVQIGGGIEDAQDNLIIWMKQNPECFQKELRELAAGGDPMADAFKAKFPGGGVPSKRWTPNEN